MDVQARENFLVVATLFEGLLAMLTFFLLPYLALTLVRR